MIDIHNDLDVSHVHFADCGFLTNPLNGFVSQTQGTEYLATAVFTCNTGYTLVGSSTRICQASGVWSTVSPVCQINGKLSQGLFSI
jgi:hypothetical protein